MGTATTCSSRLSPGRCRHPSVGDDVGKPVRHHQLQPQRDGAAKLPMWGSSSNLAAMRELLMRIRPGAQGGSRELAHHPLDGREGGCSTSSKRRPSSVSDMSRVVQLSNHCLQLSSPAPSGAGKGGAVTPISVAALVKLRWRAIMGKPRQ